MRSRYDRYTDEQKRAIFFDTEKDGSVVVSAAAGSGKTSVLVERAIRLITDPENKVPANRLALVTFTNKAADELKGRLESAVTEIEPQSEEESEWLFSQRIRLEESTISTISSFCLDILRKYGSVMGLSRKISVMEEQESERLRKKAMNDAVLSLYENTDTKAVESLIKISSPRLTNALPSILTELDGFMTLEIDRKKTTDLSLRLYNDSGSFFSLFLPYAKEKLQDYLNMAEIGVTKNHEIGSGTKAEEKLLLDVELIKASREMLEREDFDGLQKLVSVKLHVANYGKVFDENEKEELKKNREGLKKYISYAKEIVSLIKDFPKAVEYQKDGISALIDLYNDYRERFDNYKADKGKLDFSDIERKTLELLENDSVQERISESFYEIIVDEFQDVNNLQFEIFRRISRNERNLFFVGDIKQSIYKFRGANPDIFSGIMDSSVYETLILSRNFRSSIEVIDAVNEIFENIMTKKTGGANYDENHKLRDGLHISDGAEGAAEFVLITSEETEPEYIARRIKTMIESGYKITGKDGVKRTAEYSDFAVIMSAIGNREAEYTEAFEKYSVPLSRGGKGDYLKIAEVNTVIKLLSVIEDPYKDLELLHVMMSPLYDFSAEEIAALRTLGKDVPLYSNLRAALKKEFPFKKKLEKFLNNIAEWRAISENQPVDKLIREIFDSEIIYPLAAGSRDPEKTISNLNLLLFYGESYSEDRTLGAFIRLLQDIINNKLKISEADIITEDTGTVKLLTIHASKGLEYPICFVAGMNRMFNKEDTKSTVLVSDKFSLAAQYVDTETLIKYKTLSHTLTSDLINDTMISEEIRKLYVAATRARNKLIFTAGKLGEDIKFRSNTYGKMIYDVAMNSPKITVVTENEDIFENEIYELEEKSEKKSYDESISLIIDAKYHREWLTKIPKKLTATEIGVEFSVNVFSDESDEPSIFPRKPAFYKDRKITGKKRGDAYHKVMELIDFKSPDITAEIEKIKPQLSELEIMAVDFRKIEGFFQSDLGKRAVKGRVEKEFQLFTETMFSEIGINGLDEMFEERPFVQGIADMFFYEDGEIVLVDYKTNRNTSAEKLRSEYKNQLLIYKKAIEEMLEVRVKECWLYSFELNAGVYV